jgi:hypothetical protein
MRAAEAGRSAAWACALGVLATPGVVRAQPPAPCDLHLDVHFTPDVDNPRDPAFLGSLLGANPGYSLRVHRHIDGADAATYELELTGPGPNYLCRNIVDSIRRSGFVLSAEIEAPAGS